MPAIHASPSAPSDEEVHSERLSFRRPTLGDFEDSLALWSDPMVTRFVGGQPASPEEVWGRLLRYAGHWAMLDFGYWVVRARETGRFVGEVGFADYHRDLTPGFEGRPEMGWVLAPWAHGQGYATEAVRAALGWADRHWAGRETACMIAAGNEASIRVAEKVGFRETGRSTYKGGVMLLLTRIGPRPEERGA